VFRYDERFRGYSFDKVLFFYALNDEKAALIYLGTQGTFNTPDPAPPQCDDVTFLFVFRYDERFRGYGFDKVLSFSRN